MQDFLVANINNDELEDAINTERQERKEADALLLERIKEETQALQEADQNSVKKTYL